MVHPLAECPPSLVHHVTVGTIVRWPVRVGTMACGTRAVLCRTTLKQDWNCGREKRISFVYTFFMNALK